MTTLKPKYLHPVDFLAAFVKGGPGRLAFSHADAQKAGSLETIYDGPRPDGCGSILAIHYDHHRHHYLGEAGQRGSGEEGKRGVGFPNVPSANHTPAA